MFLFANFALLVIAVCQSMATPISIEPAKNTEKDAVVDTDSSLVGGLTTMFDDCEVI